VMRLNHESDITKNSSSACFCSADTHTHTYRHSLTHSLTHAHACARTHTHARTHTRTRTHAHTHLVVSACLRGTCHRCRASTKAKITSSNASSKHNDASASA
jgi:hypothetical protein